MKIINSKEFRELKESNKAFLVDFSATWCGPCKMLAPVLASVSSERNDIEVVTVDVDKDNDLARSYGIMSVPSLFLFNNGEVVAKTMGYQSKEQITDFIDKGLKG